MDFTTACNQSLLLERIVAFRNGPDYMRYVSNRVIFGEMTSIKAGGDQNLKKTNLLGQNWEKTDFRTQRHRKFFDGNF